MWFITAILMALLLFCGYAESCWIIKTHQSDDLYKNDQIKAGKITLVVGLYIVATMAVVLCRLTFDFSCGGVISLTAKTISFVMLNCAVLYVIHRIYGMVYTTLHREW